MARDTGRRPTGDEPEDDDDDERVKDVDPNLTLGEYQIVLTAPGSYTIRSEIVHAATSNARRASAAALGACWYGKGRPTVKYEHCDYNPLRYGGAVIDELLGRGIPMAKITEAATYAYAFLLVHIIREKEVAKKANFTEAGGADSRDGSPRSPTAPGSRRAGSGRSRERTR